MEKAGRRKWLITGSCLQTVFLAIVTGLSSHPRYKDSVTAAIFMFAFSIVSGSTWGPFPVSFPFPLLYQVWGRVWKTWEMTALPGVLTGTLHHTDCLCLRVNASSLSAHGLLPLFLRIGTFRVALGFRRTDLLHARWKPWMDDVDMVPGLQCDSSAV